MIKLRLAKPEEKDSVRALWSACFHDTKEYMDLWFSTSYEKAKILLAVNEEDALLGALQMLPVLFQTKEGMQQGYYIGGVSVWEEYRHKKIGSLLMKEAERIALEEQMDFCILVADVVGYYERFGYLPLDRRVNIEAKPCGREGALRKATEKDSEILLDIYNAFVSGEGVYQIRTKEDMVAMVLGESASSGAVAILRDAYVAYDTTPDTLYVDEAAWSSATGKEEVNRFIHNFGKETISLRAGSTFGMEDGNPSVMVLPLKGDFSKNGYFNVIV